MLIGKLPLPEPMIFSGGPLQCTEWKASFMTLVDNKAITAQEKFYYVKKYAGKEAGKAIQGFFLTHRGQLPSRLGNPGRTLWESIPLTKNIPRENLQLASHIPKEHRCTRVRWLPTRLPESNGTDSKPRSPE